MKALFPSFALLVATLLLGTTAGCQVYGEGPMVRVELDLDPFHSIGLGANAQVYLRPGPEQLVVVEGQQNVIDELERRVRGGSWNIGFDRNVRDYEQLLIRITLPEVESLAIGGGGSIETEEPFEGMGSLEFAIGGSGSIIFAGSARNLEVAIGGSGSVQAEDLAVESCEVAIGGSGDAYVNVAHELDVAIAGSGDVVYRGRPEVSSAIVGSGKVRSQ